jgi:protein phosphatase
MKGYISLKRMMRGGTRATPMKDDHQRKPHPPPGETILRVAPSALVVLIGPASSGKTTWARQHFEPTQIVSADACRAMIADDENDQEATRDALRLFHRIIGERLKRGLPTVADSPALTVTAREELLRDAAIYHRPAIALVFAMPSDMQQAWNSQRSRRAPPAVLAEHRQLLQHTLHVLCNEGFTQIIVLRSPEEMNRLVVRVGAFSPENDQGPFDIIGDVHGCYDELCALLSDLGYVRQGEGWAHPQRRRAVFVGDLADRGPRNVAVWKLVLAMAEQGNALLVIGNHDNKLMRWLMGRPVRVGKGLLSTISEIEALPEPEQSLFRSRLLALLRATPGYLLLDRERLVVTHAGIRDDMIGRWDRHIAAFCLYGDVAGFDADGMPQRRNWALERIARPPAPLIVYGHVVVDAPAFINNTVDIDTGCCFGGRLTALRYPERTFVSVPALQAYAEKHAERV